MSTTGNVSGGQPASTALIATTRRVTMPARGSRVASTSSGSPVGVVEHGVDACGRRRDDREPVAQAAGLEQLGDRLGRVVGDLDGARRVRGHGAPYFLTAFGVCLMASVCVQRGGRLRPGTLV